MEKGKRALLNDWDIDSSFDEYYDMQQQRKQELKVIKHLRKAFKDQNKSNKKYDNN